MGPADFVAGEFDYQDCGESCLLPNDQAVVAKQREFPKAGPGSQTFVVPGAGHNINGHRGAPRAFDQAIGFLKANGF